MELHQHWLCIGELCFFCFFKSPFVIKVLLSHCNVHQSQNPNDMFVFGSTCFVMPNMQFVLLLSASRFPHRTLFFPVPKWVVVIVVNFAS